jgi:adenine phosphoribosyltransferase
MDYYNLEFLGLTRHLPLIPISKNTKIASFNILGDVELVDAASRELARRLADYTFDCLVGPEVKVVPLIHQLAIRLHQPRYVICRKSIKPYMQQPIILKPLAYFPKHTRPLVIDGQDGAILAGKRVVIVDDVISTGVTVRMMKFLMKKIGAEVVAVVCIIRQGEGQFDPLPDLVYLATVPIFKNETAS